MGRSEFIEQVRKVFDLPDGLIGDDELRAAGGWCAPRALDDRPLFSWARPDDHRMVHRATRVDPADGRIIYRASRVYQLEQVNDDLEAAT